MTRRFWIGAGADGSRSSPWRWAGTCSTSHHLIGRRPRTGSSCCFGTPVVLWAGWPFFVRGWASVKNRSLNMFTLIALGTGAAWLYSVVGTLAPGAVSRRTARRTDGAVAVYFEAAAVITVLVLLGQVLELRAREKTSGAIKALLGPGAEDGRPGAARTASTRPCRSTMIQVGRPAARAARREGARRRRADRGQGHGRRVDGHGRADARGQGAGRQGHRRHANQTGGFVMRAEKVGADTLLVPDRPHGGRGAAQPRADPAHGRPGGGLVRARGHRVAALDLRRLAGLGPGAGVRLCARRRRWRC